MEIRERHLQAYIYVTGHHLEELLVMADRVARFF